MTAPSAEPREVVIEFEVDEADAERTYNAMAKLVHELGEIGTLSMRQRGDIDDLMRDAAELAAYKDRWAWLRSFIRPSETSKESYERILCDAARYRWLIAHPGRLVDDFYDPIMGAPMVDIDALIDAEIAREEGRCAGAALV